MKVTLINPPQLISPTNAVSTVTIPPLGLAYLAGSMRAAEHTVQIVDSIAEGINHFCPFGPYYLQGLSKEEIVARVPSDSDIIAVGLMFSCAWPATRELLNMLKSAFPEIPLVLGGEHVSALPAITFQQSAVDIAVIGEGEETLLRLLDALEQQSSLNEVSGLALPGADRRPVLTPRRARITDVDSIPVPAWELFDLEVYMQFNQPHGASRGRFIPMLATRGCPYACTFCSSPRMWGRQWIPRNPLLVVDEIEDYVRRYGVEDVQFEDQTAIIRSDWVIEFCSELKRRELRISWQLPSGTRSEAIDSNVARVMYETGCHEFSYAPESGSEETLQKIGKHVRLDRLCDSVRSAVQSNIRAGIFIVVGFPHERWIDTVPTFALIAKMAWMGAAHVNIGAFSPQPDTVLYHELTAGGRIPEELQLEDDFFFDLFGYLDLCRIKSWNTRFSNRQLCALIVLGYLVFFSVSFLRRPKRLLMLLQDIFRPRSEGKLGKYVRSVITTSRSLRSAGTQSGSKL